MVMIDARRSAGVIRSLGQGFAEPRGRGRESISEPIIDYSGTLRSVNHDGAHHASCCSLTSLHTLSTRSRVPCILPMLPKLHW